MHASSFEKANIVLVLVQRHRRCPPGRAENELPNLRAQLQEEHHTMELLWNSGGELTVNALPLVGRIVLV